MRKKAQASIEFIILIGFLFFVFILFTLLITALFTSFQEDRELKVLVDLGDVIESEIDLGLRGQEGYTRDFKLPEKLDGKDYTIIFERQSSDLLGELRIAFNQGVDEEREYIVIIPLDVVIPPVMNPGATYSVEKLSTGVQIIPA